MNRILVVSLAVDTARRERLQERFPRYFPAFEFVDAVDGRCLPASEYFSHIKGSLQRLSGILTPTEVGCALSHMKCLEEAQEMDGPVLILEDDVIGTDESLDQAIGRMAGMSGAEVMFMGGMQDLPSWTRVYGERRTDDSAGAAYKIDPCSYKYLWRTCCYAVTPLAARLLLKQQQTALHRADDWGVFFSRLPIRATLTSLLEHPPVGQNSNLSAERESMGQHKKLWRIAVERLSFNLSHRVFPCQAWLRRLQKVE